MTDEGKFSDSDKRIILFELQKTFKSKITVSEQVSEQNCSLFFSFSAGREATSSPGSKSLRTAIALQYPVPYARSLAVKGYVFTPGPDASRIARE